ncbi:hypothetical protein DFJ73DRAFT_628923 [Zopfochytrium polystomum]|nr:hypothetical protein DFJ73DRAFT_628923 [Zopfochytrium polystomum]
MANTTTAGVLADASTTSDTSSAHTHDHDNGAACTVDHDHDHDHHHHHHHHNHDHNHDNHDHDHNSTESHHDDDIGPYKVPQRAILTKEDLERWLASPTMAEFVAFVDQLNLSVRNRKLTDVLVVPEVAVTLLGVLDEIESWVSEIPPVSNSASRFGNPSYRDWFDRLEQNARSLTARLVPDPSAGRELAPYLLHSFGNRRRIDYGTGHEAHFVAFLLCLRKLDVLKDEDYPAVVLRVFWRYIAVMRTLQFTYWLEPAGSHGVWGLDDYHFLPFMFGSSQLHDHKYLRPKAIHDKDVIDEFSKDYMYLACIKFINSVKTASLRWHSPMLDDISGVKQWSKVNSGMIKMYRAEVLGKLPIMQHFLFGSLLPFEASGPVPGDNDEIAHVHAFGQAAPECCGIRVPSAIASAAADSAAAAAAAAAGGASGGLARAFGVPLAAAGGALGGRRPLPFD